MTKMLPAADCASRNRLASVVEWSMSSPSMPFESKKAVLASSNETPCLVLLLAAFLVSRSNINYVYQTGAVCKLVHERRAGAWKRAAMLSG